MLKKFVASLFGSLLLAFLLGVGMAFAQDVRPTPTNIPPPSDGGEPGGSIRGTVYVDVGGDGVCAGDPVLAGVPIEFVSNDGGTTVYLSSGSDGTYGLVAAGLGTWQVSVVPPAGYVAISSPTLAAFIDAESPVATGIDFCVAEGGTSAGTTTTTGGTQPVPVVLPESGASNTSSLVIVGLVGLLLVGLGAMIHFRRQTPSS